MELRKSRWNIDRYFFGKGKATEYDSTGLDPEMDEEWFVNWIGLTRTVLDSGHLPTASPAIAEPDSRRPYGGGDHSSARKDGRIRKKRVTCEAKPNDLPKRYCYYKMLRNE